MPRTPALKLPVLQTSGGSWFGALTICRALSRLSTRELHIVLPEVLHPPLLANAQELVLQAMATEVNLIMSELAKGNGDDPHQIKMRTMNMMSRLDANPNGTRRAPRRPGNGLSLRLM